MTSRRGAMFLTLGSVIALSEHPSNRLASALDPSIIADLAHRSPVASNLIADGTRAGRQGAPRSPADAALRAADHARKRQRGVNQRAG
jgi:hypothetical protein